MSWDTVQIPLTNRETLVRPRFWSMVQVSRQFCKTITKLMFKIRFKHVWSLRNFTLNELKNEDFRHSREVSRQAAHMKIALKK